MPSAWTHAMIGVAAGSVVTVSPAPRRFWMLAAICAMVPDIDAIGRPFGAGDVEWLGGHRALTHSLVFAAALGLAFSIGACRDPVWRRHWARLWLGLATATALHGAFDALASYGSGVMLLAPFSEVRFRAPWRPFDELLSDTFLGFVPALIVTRIVLYWRRMETPRLLRLDRLWRFLTAT